MNRMIYTNTGGFHVFALGFNDSLFNIERNLDRSVLNWRYIFIPRKIVTFPIIFKYIVDNLNIGKYYVKIYFYEQRDNPLELILYLRNEQTIYILNSSIPLYKLMKRIIINPRFSETLLFLAELEDDISNIVNRYERFAKLLNKLYPEIHKLDNLRGFGKILAIELIENSGLLNVSICVSQKNVFYRINIESINIDIKDLDQCFSN